MTPFRESPATLARAEFVRRFGDVYERNAWIAAAVFDAGAVPTSVENLAAALRDVVESAPPDAQLTLLRSHHDFVSRLLGATDPAPSWDATRTLPEVASCTDAERRAFERLDTAYRARFGFPFVADTHGISRGTVLERFAERLGNSPAAEWRAALDELHRIALLRLFGLAS